MNKIMKVLGVIMLLFGIIILIEELGFFSIEIGINKILIGSLILIIVQFLNIAFSKIYNGVFHPIAIIMLIIIIIPIILYFYTNIADNILPIAISVMMLFESIYMLH